MMYHGDRSLVGKIQNPIFRTSQIVPEVCGAGIEAVIFEWQGEGLHTKGSI